MDSTERLLEELTNAHGAAGFEEAVRKVVRRELSPLCDSIETDELGSVIARMRGGAPSPKVMLAAHMDEVSLIVKYVTPDGFVKFHPLGYWLNHALINQRWVVLTRRGPVPGITGIKSPHSVNDEAQELSLSDQRQMFIDVGATSQKDAEERLSIRPGDAIVPDSRFQVLAGGQLYVAKAFDDRVGLAVVIEAVRQFVANPPRCAVYAVATVQEEVGSRGAHTSVFQARPDIAINLEAGLAADYPGVTMDEAQERLGAGPTLFMHDNSMLPNLKLRQLILETAGKHGIPLQFEVVTDYGDDGDEIQRAYSGIPAVNIGVPTRYLHSHNSMLHREDFDNTVRLIVALVRRLGAEEVQRIRSFS